MTSPLDKRVLLINIDPQSNLTHALGYDSTPRSAPLGLLSAEAAADEQAASIAAALDPATLCRQAQHALGLAGIGSRIAPEDNAIGIYAALPAPTVVTPLVLKGRALLWAVSRAQAEATQALIATALAIMGAA